MSALLLAENPLWLNGPGWLCSEGTFHEAKDDIEDSIPGICQAEMKKKTAFSLVATIEDAGESELFEPQRCSSSHRLYIITELVIRFTKFLRSKIKGCESSGHKSPLTNLERARCYWIRQTQSLLQESRNFSGLKRQVDLYCDDLGIWRCGGRMANSGLSLSAQNPILLDKGHHLAKLVVMDAHKCVLHDGVRETLAELRSTYWIVQGRQFIRKLLHRCVVCRRFEGMPCRSKPSPPLPDFRVRQSRPFQTTGLDFAGPFYIWTSSGPRNSKTWLCLYTCYSTRAVHLDLVTDMTATSFLRSFQRFSARRGVPSCMVSDNAKTFKCTTVAIKNMIESSEFANYFSRLHIEWRFNLEKAPWWGGVFECMVKSAKRCLRKAIGRNSLSHDELLTLVVKVESVLNSRPLTYVSSEDMEEPLTPSHLLIGYRILSLPDPTVHSDDPDVYSSDPPEALSRRMCHLTKTLQKFWKRWKREYLLELREHHHTRLARGETRDLMVGEIVTVYDEGRPRGLWRLGRIQELIHGVDDVVRGGKVKVVSSKGSMKILRRPIQHVYPLEVYQSSHENIEKVPEVDATLEANDDLTPSAVRNSRPQRLAAKNAREIVRCITED